MNNVLSIGPDTRLCLGLVYQLVRDGYLVSLSPEAYEAMARSRERLIKAARHGPVYGVNTGFGELKDVLIPAKDAWSLQVNLVRSHSAGVGEPASQGIVMLTALFKAVELARGASGVRPEVTEALLNVFNKRIHVYMPIHGSVGASGDLAPLAHLALFLIGEGEYLVRGARRHGLPEDMEPLMLEEKEGLSLVNGTAFSLALLSHALLRAYRLLDRVLIGLALSFAAMKGNTNALEPFIHSSKQHLGQSYVAAKMRSLLEGTDLVINTSDGSEQDPYCLRCIPQVAGPVVDALEYARRIAEEEMNSVSDNPLVDERGRIYSGCNFHAMYLAQASDLLRASIPVLGELMEKHVDRLLRGAHRAGLPKFLAGKPGLDSGLMLLQYTMASLLAEAKALSSPASIHNTPTSAGQEDVNSMSVPSLVLLEEQLERLEWMASGLMTAAILALRARIGDMAPRGRIGGFYRLFSGAVNYRILEEDTPYYASLEEMRNTLFPRGLQRYEYYVVRDLVEKT